LHHERNFVCFEIKPDEKGGIFWNICGTIECLQTFAVEFGDRCGEEMIKVVL